MFCYLHLLRLLVSVEIWLTQNVNFLLLFIMEHEDSYSLELGKLGLNITYFVKPAPNV